MHDGIADMAESVVKDKFPQFRPLNEHGKAKLEAKTKEMREATEGIMDKILKLIQSSDMPPELILKKDPDHQLADLNQTMQAAR